jgi:hypothetical protein
LDLAEFGNADRVARDVAQAVLAAQFLLDAVEDPIHAHLLCNLEKSAAGLTGHVHHGAFAGGTREGESVGAWVGEQDRIDQRVGPLRRCDRLCQGGFAARIHTVGEHDQRLAVAGTLHNLLCRRHHRVVEQCAASGLNPQLPGGRGIHVGQDIAQRLAR